MALDPRSPATSYLRTTFTTEDGLGANVVNDILQSKDGFLWIAGYEGLTRFDGRHFTLVDFPQLLVNVNSIAEGRDGDLWLGTLAGVMRISPRILDEPGEPRVAVYHLGSGSDDAVRRVRVTRDGTLWAGTRSGLYRWDGAGGFSEVIRELAVSRIEEAPDGHILVPGPAGYVEWDGAHAVVHPEVSRELGLGSDQVFQVHPDRQNVLWFSTARGLFRQLDGSFTNIGGTGKAAYETYEDQNGNTFVSTDGGVFRVRGGTLEPLAPGLKCRVLRADRDGGLWIGTNGAGLVHLRDRSVRMFTADDGLRSDVVMAVLSTRSGKLWVATNCGGIAWLDGDRFQPLPDKDHRADCAYSLAEDSTNDLLVGTFGSGLFRLHDGQLTQYLKTPALPSDNVFGLLTAHDGSLWIQTPRGLVQLRDGKLRTYTTADGLSATNVRYLYEDGAGTIWAATAKGVDRLTGDRFSPAMVRRDPVPLGQSGGGFYIRFADGVTRFDGPKTTVAFRAFVDASSMIMVTNELWLAKHDGIARTTPEAMGRWEADHGIPLDFAVFTRTDGMRSAECTSAPTTPHMTVTPDGRLWVATEQGLAMIDLPNLPRAADKPVVYIRDLVVGRAQQRPGAKLTLPAGTSHLEMAFDVVELSSPEKIRLQYRLDGVDDGWLDAPASHVATYSGIAPGSHRFHVRATNRDGIWDQAGIVYVVTQTPFVYQTRWFQSLCVAALLAALWGVYRYRVRQLAHEFNVRLDARVNERTRIARELHDTLLQSFQGLMLRLQAVDDLLPEGKAKDQLDRTMQRADQAIAEGRTAVFDLRASALTTNDLAKAIKGLGDELATADSAVLRLMVEGASRELHPIIRDEVYRIAREALSNAFRHSDARNIETELSYGDRAFRLRIRDDGMGISPEILEQGRSGHYGLQGMRERARQTGGTLDVWSKAGAGTEIELTIPGSIAYRTARGAGLAGLFRRKGGHS
jgi:signal transduction histidine kinase/ligand-binding sensor domain-containing protein